MPAVNTGLGRLPSAPVFLVLVLAMVMLGCGNAGHRYLETGKQYLARDEYSEAVMQFRQAARLLPDDAEPFYQLGVAYRRVGDSNSAAHYFQRAIQLNPRLVPAQVNLAELLAAQSDPALLEDARRRAGAALALEPVNPDAMAALALADLQLGSTVSGQKLLQETLRRWPQELRASIILATLRLSQNDAGAAEQVLKEAFRRAPGSPDAAIALGRYYLAVGKTTDAERQLRTALALEPHNFLALLDLGAVLQKESLTDAAASVYRKLAALNLPGYRSVYVSFLLKYGRSEEALDEATRLSLRRPNDRTARSERIALLLLLHRSGEVEKMLNAILDENPKDVDALLQRSEVYMASGQLQKARNDLDTVLAAKPDSVLGHYLSAHLNMGQGSRRNRVRELQQVLALDPKFLAARLDLSAEDMAGGDARAALDLLDRAPESQRNDRRTVSARIWALYGIGEFGEMERAVDRALQASASPDLLLQKALVEAHRQNLAGAEAYLRRVLEQEPDNVRALEVLAAVGGAGRPSSGLESVRRYAAAHASSGAVQSFLGTRLLAAGDLAGAEAAFALAEQAPPGSLRPAFGLAEVDLAAGRVDSARGRLKAVLAKDPNDSDAHFLSGLLEQAGGNPGESVQNYRRAADMDSDDYVTLNNLAFSLAALHRPDDALRYAQRAKDLAPNNAAVDDTLGWIFYQKGVYLSAVGQLERSVQNDRQAISMYHLAMAYGRAGQTERGKAMFQQAIALDSSLPEAAQARQILSEVKGP